MKCISSVNKIDIFYSEMTFQKILIEGFLSETFSIHPKKANILFNVHVYLFGEMF